MRKWKERNVTFVFDQVMTDQNLLEDGKIDELAYDYLIKFISI